MTDGKWPRNPLAPKVRAHPGRSSLVFGAAFAFLCFVAGAGDLSGPEESIVLAVLALSLGAVSAAAFYFGARYLGSRLG